MQIRGFDGQIAKVGGANQALRASIYPNEVGILGSYGLGLVTGLIGAAIAANSEIFQFRWTDATRFARIKSVRVGAGVITAFTAGAGQLSLHVARAFTVDGTGGSPVTMATNDQKHKTSMGVTLAPSALGVRVATTAALGAGTKTLDTNPLAVLGFGCPAVAGQSIINPGTELFSSRERFPIILAANEGIVIRVPSIPATGTWTAGIDIVWDEVAAADL